jgi:hypothetical protein
MTYARTPPTRGHFEDARFASADLRISRQVSPFYESKGKQMPKKTSTKKVVAKKVTTKIKPATQAGMIKKSKVTAPAIPLAEQIRNTFMKAREQAKADYDKGFALIEKQLTQAKSRAEKAKAAKAGAQQKLAKAKDSAKGKTGKAVKASIDKASQAVKKAEALLAEPVAIYQALLIEQGHLKAAMKKFTAINKLTDQFEKKADKKKPAAKKAKGEKAKKEARPEKEGVTKKQKPAIPAQAELSSTPPDADSNNDILSLMWEG